MLPNKTLSEGICQRHMASLPLGQAGGYVVRIILMIIIILFQCFSESFAQEQEISSSGIYLGPFLSFSPLKIEHSKYLFAFGGQLLYPLSNHYISLVYHRSNAVNLKAADADPDDDSRIDRVELCYGKIACIGDHHKLLRNVCIGVLIGLSYYTINYYADDITLYQRHASYAHGIGVPLGLTVTNSFGKQIFFGYGVKCTIGNTIGARENFFLDYALFLMINLF
jgi:hypothetical protein